MKLPGELIDGLVCAPYATDASNVPTAAAIAKALSDATCAQVEMWLGMGEQVDIESWPTPKSGLGYQAGRVRAYAMPDKPSPRAVRILLLQGLVTGLAI